jgi:hypothetical protein
MVLIMGFETFSNHELRQAFNRTENESDELYPARHHIVEEMTRRAMHSRPYIPPEAPQSTEAPKEDYSAVRLKLAEYGLNMPVYDASQDDYDNPDHIDSVWPSVN